MSDSGFDLKRDGLGIGLFALGTFFAVLGAYSALRHGTGQGSATGSAALAEAWLAAIGVIPGLVFSGGVALVGARIWLSGRAQRVVHQLLAFAGLAVGAAVLAGALSPSAGGRLGFATGGLVSEAVHPIAGILCGLLATGAAVWFGWLRTTRSESLDEPTLVRNPDLPDLAFDDLGVSADEAAALIPEDFHRPAKASRKQAQPAVHTPPASPYPEDVRRQGKIPAGARPLSAPPRATPPRMSNPSAPMPKVRLQLQPCTDGPPRVPTGPSALARIWLHRRASPLPSTPSSPLPRASRAKPTRSR